MFELTSQFRLTMLVTCLINILQVAAADDEQLVFFENRIRPVLSQHCYNCHSQRAKVVQGGLFVDSYDGLIQGGDSGPAIVPGNPEESLLISALKHDSFKMPPKGKLQDKVIADFRHWVSGGAQTPESFKTNGLVAGSEIDWDSALRHWAYQPLQTAAAPRVNDTSWLTNDIDRFILHRLEQHGLPTPLMASPTTLIRRTFYDLIGLPPTPAELARFELQLQTPNGFQSMVMELLNSEHYGERWGRHWLDVARYSDSNGADENKPYPQAWRYRNYVIDQFNRDTPYNTFIHQQVAGDLLDATSVKQANDHIIATTFLALGVKIDAEQDPVKKRSDIVDEQIDTIGRAFMGVTVGCARCHDHKFDPFTTEDYYAMAGILRSTQLTTVGLKSDQEPKLIARNKLLHSNRQELLMNRGQQLGLLAQLNAQKYLPFVPEVLRWQNTQLDSELRIRLSKSADQPWSPVGQLMDLNDGGQIQRIQAETFARGNFGIVTDGYGEGIGIISDKNGSGLQTFEHDISVPSAGMYQLDIRYAAAAARPGKLFLNGVLVKSAAIGEVTGGWNPENQKWHVSGRYNFKAGNNVLRFEVQNVMSHIDQIAISPVLEDFGHVREAEDFDRGDFSRINQGYGEGIGIAATSKNNELTFIEYDLKDIAPGKHVLQFRYASDAVRPMKLILDDKLIDDQAFQEVTGGWNPGNQKWITVGELKLSHPHHVLRLEASNVSVHLDKLRLIPHVAESMLPSLMEIATKHQLDHGVLNRWATVAKQISATTPAVDAWLRKGEATPQLLTNPEATAVTKLLFAPALRRELSESDDKRIVEIDAEISRNRQQLEKLKSLVAMAAAEGDVSDMQIHIRGSHLQKGGVVARRAPRILTRSEVAGLETQQSGRLELAQAITSSDTPLAARVISNRIWRWHFGKPLVRSTENFGTSGKEPSHPELLDYLAHYLIEHDWSLKALHQHITESSTYRMGHVFNESSAAIDPDNRWYWRHTPRRLEVEAIRDTLLSVSGELDRTIGGAEFEGIATLSPSPQALMANRRTYENSKRRSVYLPIVRTNVYKLLTLFDFPNPAFPTGNRQTTTLPTQAMFLMNSPWVTKLGTAMANRLAKSTGDSIERVNLAYKLCYCRLATESEVMDAIGFINQYGKESEEAQAEAWSAFCQLLFLSNEFTYIN